MRLKLAHISQDCSALLAGKLGGQCYGNSPSKQECEAAIKPCNSWGRG